MNTKTEPTAVLWVACQSAFVTVNYNTGDASRISPRDAVALYVQGAAFGKNAEREIQPLLTVNDRLAILAREYDNGNYQGPGEYLAAVTRVTSRPVWGGQLLGWTTEAEVKALDNSIKTDW